MQKTRFNCFFFSVVEIDNAIFFSQIKPRAEGEKSTDKDDESKGLADSDSEEDEDLLFDPTPLYKQILEYLEMGETVSKALCRLGKGKKRMTTAERWKKKKELAAKQESAKTDGNSEKEGDSKKMDAPKVPLDSDENSEKIVKLTELANELLTRTGNMDIYQESYDSIKKKVKIYSFIFSKSYKQKFNKKIKFLKNSNWPELKKKLIK